MLTEEERKHVRLSATVDPRGSWSEIDNVNDEDVQVEVKGGVVYVSLSDKLLFSSGCSKVTSQANEV